jgi:hypothetical protein
MICFLENAILGHCVFNFVFLYDDFLLEDLDGEELARILFTAQNHFAEGAFAEDF